MDCQICHGHPIGSSCLLCGAKPIKQKKKLKKLKIGQKKKREDWTRTDFRQEWYDETRGQMVKYNQRTTGIPALDEKIRKATA